MLFIRTAKVSRMNLQRMDGSFNAAPDCIASHIYKATGEDKSHSLDHLIRKCTCFFIKVIPNHASYMNMCVYVWQKCFLLYLFYLLGLLLQQSLLIGGLKGIKSVGVIKCSGSWTATGWCRSIADNKTYHTFI